MQHCTTQCPSGTLELHKHLLNPTHSGPNWVAQLISQSIGESAHNLCLSESPAHVQSTVFSFFFLSLFLFFLRWSKSTVWKRRVTGIFCPPNIISITSLLPNSTQFWKIHKLSLHLEEKKMTQTCNPEKKIKRGTENAQKLEQRLKKQIKT